MQKHYSTVAPVEQRESIGKVIDLVRIRRDAASNRLFSLQVSGAGEGI